MDGCLSHLWLFLGDLKGIRAAMFGPTACSSVIQHVGWKQADGEDTSLPNVHVVNLDHDPRQRKGINYDPLPQHIIEGRKEDARSQAPHPPLPLPSTLHPPIRRPTILEPPRPHSRLLLPRPRRLLLQNLRMPMHARQKPHPHRPPHRLADPPLIHPSQPRLAAMP